MKSILIALLFLALINLSYGQVKTNLNNRDQISSGGKFQKGFRGKGPYVIAARDIKALLDKEALENADGVARPFKIAEPIKVDIDVVKEADWTEEEGFAFGKFTLVAASAKSISVNFDRFYLPAGTELYVYSENGEMITGPVTEAENNENNFWGSWVYKGGKLTIDFKVPLESKSSLKLHLSSVAYGYKDVYKTEVSDFGASASCNINVLCPPGNGWENERNSVALILNGNSSNLCSGALVNNTCNLDISYLLTANHCFDGNVTQWKFTFQAWSPTCTPSQNVNGVTFNGSTLRARHGGSDFCLVELNQLPPPSSGIAFSGWSRNINGIQNTTIIHHPAGDLMKISRDNNAPAFGTFNDAQCWRLGLDEGATEGGSSGSPYYDQNHRIIGQHFGTGDSNLPICERVNKSGGRFDVSWTGGGTNATRLSNWLDPGNTGLFTTNARRRSFATGPPVVCTSGGTFTLNNSPAGSQITWIATPQNLFAVSSGAFVGNGGNQNISLAAANSNVSGQGTLTYTINNTGCGGSVQVQAPVWVGRRTPTGFSSVIVDPYLGRIKARVEAVPNAINYSWYLDGVLYTGPGSNSDYVTMPIQKNNCTIPNYSIGVKANNACGVSSTYSELHPNPCYNGGFFYSYFPNPASETLTIERTYNMEENSEIGTFLKEGFSDTHHYRLYDFNSYKVVLEGSFSGKTNINVSKLNKGRYVLIIQIGKGKEETHHVIIN